MDWINGSRSSRIASFIRYSLVALGVAALFLSLVTWPWRNVGLPIAFAIAYAAVWSVSLRLTRGDIVNIDASIGIAAALVLPVQAAIVASVVGASLGGLADRRNPRETRGVWSAALTRPLPVLAAATTCRLLGQPDAVAQQASFVLVATLAGMAYLAVDALTVNQRGQVSRTGLLAAIRPLGTLYLGHLSIGVVMGLLFPWMGMVGLLVLTLLVLVMQNSYSMYLRTRVAYQETIGVLALASELQMPMAAGHAHRVADAAAATGKALGLPSRMLETLNYAALLHDIGRIGLEDDVEVPQEGTHARVGAEMVEAIPFLASAKPIIEHHHDLDALPEGLDEDSKLGSCIVGICCEYDHLRARGLSHMQAMDELLGRYESDLACRVMHVVMHLQGVEWGLTGGAESPADGGGVQ